MNASKRKGTAFESHITEWLREILHNPRIERRALAGKEDKGDIAGVRTFHDNEVVIECKNQNRLSLAEWVDEANREAMAAGADGGVVVHKRRGVGAAGGQYVTMDAATFAWLLQGGPE